MRNVAQRVGRAGAICFVLSCASPALAQPVDAATRASARQLAEEGMKLSDKGDCKGAVEKLTKAHAMVRVPTLAFYAGKCLEKLGRLVEASESYRAAEQDEVEAGAPAVHRAAQADAATARAALLPRIPTVEIIVKPMPESIALDDQPLPVAALRAPRPIDPGRHFVEARAGSVVVRREFAVEEGEHGQIALRLVAPTPGMTSSAPPPPVPPSPPVSSAPSGPGPGPWIVGGVGLAALLAGGVLGGVVLKEKNATSGCTDGPPPTCPTQAGVDAASTGRALGPATTALLIVGGAGVIAGGVWLGLRPSSRAGARVGVGPVAGGAAWRVEGAW